MWSNESSFLLSWGPPAPGMGQKTIIRGGVCVEVIPMCCVALSLYSSGLGHSVCKETVHLRTMAFWTQNPSRDVTLDALGNFRRKFQLGWRDRWWRPIGPALCDVWDRAPASGAGVSVQNTVGDRRTLTLPEGQCLGDVCIPWGQEFGVWDLHGGSAAVGISGWHSVGWTSRWKMWISDSHSSLLLPQGSSPPTPTAFLFFSF